MQVQTFNATIHAHIFEPFEEFDSTEQLDKFLEQYAFKERAWAFRRSGKTLYVSNRMKPVSLIGLFEDLNDFYKQAAPEKVITLKGQQLPKRVV
jgi:hypothetical protein